MDTNEFVGKGSLIKLTFENIRRRRYSDECQKKSPDKQAKKDTRTKIINKRSKTNTKQANGLFSSLWNSDNDIRKF